MFSPRCSTCCGHEAPVAQHSHELRVELTRSGERHQPRDHPPGVVGARGEDEIGAGAQGELRPLGRQRAMEDPERIRDCDPAEAEVSQQRVRLRLERRAARRRAADRWRARPSRTGLPPGSPRGTEPGPPTAGRRRRVPRRWTPVSSQGPGSASRTQHDRDRGQRRRRTRAGRSAASRAGRRAGRARGERRVNSFAPKRRRRRRSRSTGLGSAAIGRRRSPRGDRAERLHGPAFLVGEDERASRPRSVRVPLPNEHAAEPRPGRHPGDDDRCRLFVRGHRRDLGFDGAGEQKRQRLDDRGEHGATVAFRRWP